MKNFICERLNICISSAKLSLLLVVITLSLQTYMIARSLVLMYDINGINSGIQDDYYRLKRIRSIAENLSIAYISANEADYKRYCSAMSSIEEEISLDKVIKEELGLLNKTKGLENFARKEAQACRTKKITYEKNNKIISKYFTAVSSYAGDFSISKFTVNGSPVTERLNFLMRKLVIVSAAISCVIYILIILIFIYMRKVNEEMKDKINDIIKLKNGIDNTPLPTLITDTDGKIEYVNCAFCDTYGYKREEAIGRNPRVIKSPNTKKEIYENLWKTIKRGDKWTGQFENLSKNGDKVIVQAYISPIKNSEGKLSHFMGIHKDITVQQRLIKMLAEARHEAESANQAKSDFLSSMSHEIRTPLNAIVGMADLLDEVNLSGEQKRYLEILRSASDSLLALVNDILDISKIESGKVELEKTDFNLEEMAYKISEIMSVRAFKKDVEVTCRIAPDTPVMLAGDPTRLRQVLINFMGNSVKFVEKGWVSLEIKKEKEENGRVYINFAVKDTGIGIAEDKIEKIFDKFSQAEVSTSRKYGGTGLGLPISKMLVEMMGGEVKVESKLGAGSVFSFTLPFEMSKGEKKIFLEPAAIDKLKGVKILVTDDNAVNRVIFKEILNGYGALTADARDGEEAVKILRENDSKDPFRILYLDFNMPGINGLQTAEEILKDPAIKNKPAIVPFTSDSIKVNRDSFRKIGIENFMVKPVKKKDLIEMTLGLLGKKSSEIKGEEKKEAQYSRQDLPALNILIADDSEDNITLMKSFLKDSAVKADFAKDGVEAFEKARENSYDAVFMDMQMPNLDGMGSMLKIRDWEKSNGKVRNRIIALTAMALKEEVDKAMKAGFDDYLTKPIRKNVFYAYLVHMKK